MDAVILMGQRIVATRLRYRIVAGYNATYSSKRCSMAVATFDTLKFANTLKAAGVPEKQAEAQAVAFAEVVQANFKELVTKDDLKLTKDDLKKELDDLRKDLRIEISEVKTELKQDIKDLEQRLNVKIDNGLGDVKVQIAQVKGELVLVRWMLGVLVGGVFAMLIRLFFFRGPI